MKKKFLALLLGGVMAVGGLFMQMPGHGLRRDQGGI